MKDNGSKRRFRNKVVAFRMTQEESELLNMLVAISGLTKQDYLIKRALQRKIEVRGNPRTYKALKDSLAAVLEELKRMSAVSEENSGLLALIEQINITINGFGQ